MIRILLLPILALALVSCGSDRFSNRWTPAGPPPVQAPPPTIYQQNPNADLELPTAPRSSLGGGQSSIIASPLPNSPKEGLPPAPGTVVANIPTPPSIPVAPVPPRGNVGPLGTWNVSDTDGSCRVTLTSQSFFEYNRASSNCKGASLSKVNAWEKRGNDVVLLEPGGKVAARLSPQGNGSYAGSTSKGADVNMSR